MLPQTHCTASQILSMLQFNEEKVYETFKVSQATVLEQNDLEIVISGKTVTSTKSLETDDTNACTYLTLGIIDALSLQQGNNVQELKSFVQHSNVKYSCTPSFIRVNCHR